MIPSEYKNVLSREEFWMIKRYGINEAQWLNERFNANISVTEYNTRKRNIIETDEYLQYDFIFPYSIEALQRIRDSYELVLVSRRTDPTALYEEIRRFKILSFFSDVIVVPHINITKADYIKKKYNVSLNDIIVGDTEDDIECGLCLGIRVYFVLSGIRDKWIVKKYQNEDIVIINSIQDL